MQADRAEELLGLVDEEEALSDALDVSIVFHRTYGLRHSGRYRDAATAARAAWVTANSRVLPHVALEAGVVLGQTLHDLGQLEEAEQIAFEVAPLGERLRMTSYRTPAVSRLQAELETLRGDWRQGLGHLVANVESTADPHYRIGEHEVIALLLARLGLAGRTTRRSSGGSNSPRRTPSSRGARGARAQLRLASVYALAKVGRVEDARAELDVWHEGRPGRHRFVGCTKQLRAIRSDRGCRAGQRSAAEASAAARREAERLELRVEEIWQRLDEAMMLKQDDSGCGASRRRRPGRCRSARAPRPKSRDSGCVHTEFAPGSVEAPVIRRSPSGSSRSLGLSRTVPRTPRSRLASSSRERPWNDTSRMRSASWAPATGPSSRQRSRAGSCGSSPMIGESLRP